MELKINEQVKGTRILIGDEARKRRKIINKLSEIAIEYNYDEISIPSMDKSEIYSDKLGKEKETQIYNFTDKGNRELCLRPECTATIQAIQRKYYKTQKNVKFFYCEKCWRYEKPQKGRYREFTQFGLEWLNPTSLENKKEIIMYIAERMISSFTSNYKIIEDTTRGLSYYEEGKGFEIIIPSLGAQKQVVGGGSYEGGIGFAIGVDRLMLAI